MSVQFIFDSRLNKGYLEGLYEGNIDYAFDLFEIYLTTLPSHMEDAWEIFHSEKYDEAKRYAHAIVNQPNFAMVGLSHLSEMAGALEELLIEEKITASQQKFALLYEAFHQTLPIIQEEYLRMKDFLQQYSKP